MAFAGITAFNNVGPVKYDTLKYGDYFSIDPFSMVLSFVRSEVTDKVTIVAQTGWGELQSYVIDADVTLLEPVYKKRR